MTVRPVLAAVLVLAAGLAPLLAAGCARPAPAQDTVRVAAASGLQYALPAVLDDFRAEHSALAVDVSYASSGSLYQQLTHGSPADLFLSADVAYAEQLVDDGRADRGELFRYARGRLVLWAGDGAAADPGDGMSAVRDAARVAIANPSHAPYGQAAAAALRAAGEYDAVADRLVTGDSVAQAAEFVAAGNAELGLVALAQVEAPPLRGVGTWELVPADLHPPLDHAGVVLADAPAGEQAAALREHLRSPAGAAVLQRYGFTPAAR